ncbi:unnamed protein product [Parascedosporium putredinis]|uniref:Zn(2)-C6 fungal-type domain-containing protein n=2 Tax=Parascedosporium putredinis TaxID=1442378 RepID=A0A9P1MA09_9PEZI|nr:unnamed protein product [Parascedosporium putredinis]CAI7995780.1 unnamed protein product [Parascedosporium putredinis]
MDMDGFTSQDSYDAIRSAGSHFSDSLYPHSPASRTDEEIELLRNPDVGIPPQLTFDLGGSLLDFTPSTEVDDRVRVGDLNGHLLTAQDGPPRLSDSTKSWVYVDTISTVSSDFQKRGRKPLAPSEREASKKKQLRASAPKGVPRRTKPLSDISKQEIKEIKALGGACCACRYKKNKCIINPKSPQNGPCKRCTKLHPGLCYRYSVHDASLYREQARPYFRFSQRWRTMDLVDIQAWASSEEKFIEVSQTFVNAPYQLRVRQFIPQEGDNLEEEWFDGETMRSIVGNETLGLRSEVTDPSSPWDRCFPIPRHVCAARVHSLHKIPPAVEPGSPLPARQSDPEGIPDRLAQRLPRPLRAASQLRPLIQRDHMYAQQINLGTEYANPDAVKNHARGVITLLAHYHIVMQGALPFKCVAEQQTASIKTKLDFTAQEQEFVGKTYDRVQELNWKPDKMD